MAKVIVQVKADCDVVQNKDKETKRESVNVFFDLVGLTFK